RNHHGRRLRMRSGENARCARRQNQGQLRWSARASSLSRDRCPHCETSSALRDVRRTAADRRAVSSRRTARLRVQNFVGSDCGTPWRSHYRCNKGGEITSPKKEQGWCPARKIVSTLLSRKWKI